MKRSIATRCFFVLPVLLIGCNSPEFRHDHALRQEGVHQLQADVVRREADRQEQLLELSDSSHRLRRWRTDNLDYTLRMPEERERRRRDRVQEQAAERHERIRSIFRGKPETIPRTWADMVY